MASKQAEARIEVEKEDMTDEEMMSFESELKRSLDIAEDNKKKSKDKEEKQKSEQRRERPNAQSTDIVKVKSGVLPPSESDDSASSLKILTDDEQAAVRKRNLDRKTSYYHSESMKKYHVVPVRLAEDSNTGEEIWEEKKYTYHELTFEQEDKLQELRAAMDDLEKQTYIFNRQRAMVNDREYQNVKRQWQRARRNWAFFAAKSFLRMADEDINRCKSTTLINVIEACEYRNAVTVPF